MQIITSKRANHLRAAIFDFDGTISTLRCGWEQVMLPLMTEYTSPDMEDTCKQYISESTGIQTIHQMKWLCEQVMLCGNPKKAPNDPWFFKEEYNRRLMRQVAVRRDAVIRDPSLRRQYLIAGADSFLKKLHENGILLYAASGTDEEDVKKEAAALGVAKYFQSIHGALAFKENCSKEAVIDNLLKTCRLAPESILICGDGKVEIGLGGKNGCVTLGVASDEEKLCGINEQKKERLLQAGADAIIGDFSETEALANWLAL